MNATWQERSTAPGVMLATDFSKPEDVLPYRYANAQNQAQMDGLMQQVNPYVDNGVPCLRIDVTANSPFGGYNQGQAWRRRFRPLAQWPNDGDGVDTDPYWVQFGFKIPAARLIPFAPNAGTWKFAIFANISVTRPTGMGGQSSNNHSHVLTNRGSLHGGPRHDWPIVYRHTDQVPNGDPFEGLASWNTQNDLDLSPGWDRGAQFADPLDRFCAYSNPRGCPLWPVDQWVWFQYYQRTRTYGGTAGNELDLWWALPGDTKWTLLQSHRDYLVGSREANFPKGINAVHLTPYETDRTAPGGVDSYMLYKQLIISTQEIAFPADEPKPDTQPVGDQMSTITIIKDAADTVNVMTAADFDALVAKAGERDAIQKRFDAYVVAVKAKAQEAKDRDAATAEGQSVLDIVP